MGSDKKRVQFRALDRLIDRADALASVLGEDRTDVLVPETVLAELREVASFDDEHGRAADAVLARIDATTPTLLSVLVRTEEFAPGEGVALLDAIRRTRSWESNSYVRRARSLLEPTG